MSVESLFAQLLTALGYPPNGDLAETPSRAATLWTQKLLAHRDTDPASVLGPGVANSSKSPVVLDGIAVHLVCPHHLTVAFGTARVAYTPNGRLAAFGSIVKLVEAATCKLTLQEDASDAIARALVDELGARAALAVIDAKHPCHNVTHEQALHSQAVTYGAAGDAGEVERLRALVTAPRGSGTSSTRSPARPRARGGRARRRGAR